MYYLAIEGASDSGFTTGNVSMTLHVLGVDTYKSPLGELNVSWGHRQKHSTRWIRKFVVNVFPFKVTEDASGDYGDLQKLERLLYKPYIRLVRVGTDLPHTGTTDDGLTNYKLYEDTTNGILADDYFNVARTSGPEATYDYDNGRVSLAFTLEAKEPNV